MAVIQSEYYSMEMCGFVSFSAVLPIDLPPTATLPPRYAGGPWRCTCSMATAVRATTG